MNTFKEEYKTTFDSRPTNLCDNCDKVMEPNSYYHISMNMDRVTDKPPEMPPPIAYMRFFTCSKECSMMFILKYM